MSDVTVIGGGVIGLSVALELARRGRRVTLVSDGAPHASAAAAGMLAPASEALLDDLAPDVGMLLVARARWSAWAARLGVGLDTSGALHVATPAELDRRQAAAQGLGLAVERRSEGLWLPQDARVDPEAALRRLRAAASEAGVALRSGRVQARDGQLTWEGVALGGEAVIAAGWGSAALAAAAPELRALRPIKGQLLRVAAAHASGPVLRLCDVYLAPDARGWSVGATMEVGRHDLAPDARALARLRAAAAAVIPALATGAATPAVGVRAATEDGRPLVGRSRTGVWLATGMRRNGWLLAPLVAETLAEAMSGVAAQDAASPVHRLGEWSPRRVSA